MTVATIRIASDAEIDRVRTAYREWGYGGGMTPNDIVFLAELDGNLVGVVRETSEHGEVLLRGMQVAPAVQRSGVGAQLLQVFVHRLNGRECYCVPYTHLVGFYSSVGFEQHPGEFAPAFLRERLAKYRREGRNVLLMRRPRAASRNNV